MKKCKKHKFTEEALNEYFKRPKCIECGDCQCKLCKVTCWDPNCRDHLKEE